MEDPEKRNICCFVRNVDEGNLFVGKVKLKNSLLTGICLFGNVENQNGFQLIYLL